MPFTAKAKNLLLIIQNSIYMKINILAKTSILHNTMDVSVKERREGVVTPPLENAVGGVNQPLW